MGQVVVSRPGDESRVRLFCGSTRIFNKLALLVGFVKIYFGYFEIFQLVG